MNNRILLASLAALILAATASLGQEADDPDPQPAKKEVVRSIACVVPGVKGGKVTATFSVSNNDPPQATDFGEGKVLHQALYSTDEDGRYTIEVPEELAGNPALRLSVMVDHLEYHHRSIGPVPARRTSPSKASCGIRWEKSSATSRAS